MKKDLNANFKKVKEGLAKSFDKAKEIAEEAYSVSAPIIDKAAQNVKEFTVEKAVPAAIKAAGDAKDFTTEKAIPAVMKAANDTKEFATDKAIPAMKQVIATTKDSTEEVIQKIKDNGFTFGSEEEALEILGIIYSKSITGIPKVSAPVEDVCAEYLRRYKDAKKAAQKMCAADMAKCTTSGFITGLGGLGTLVITLPANVSSVLYFQIRMIASVARLAGLDLQADATRTFVYACLAGVSVAEAVKKTGITIGEKMATAAISKIPGKTLTAINQKVGFRMLTKFGEKGAINLVEIVPVIGGVVGGGFDLVTTKLIADRAIKEFFDGIFDEDDCIENNVIDAEFETIIDEALQIEENTKQE